MIDNILHTGIGEVNHQGGMYVSTPTGGVAVEKWVYDADTGVKTYTVGPRAGQTEQVSEPRSNTSNRPGTTNDGTAAAASSPRNDTTTTIKEDEEDNTMLYVAVLAMAGAIAYKSSKSKGKKKKRR